MALSIFLIQKISFSCMFDNIHYHLCKNQKFEYTLNTEGEDIFETQTVF